MKRGLERHGITVAVMGHDQPDPADFAVVWGAPTRHPQLAIAAPHLLVMERAHLPDRMRNTSIGWDGLGRGGRYPVADDGGARWRERYSHLLEPWKRGGFYALLLGQVEDDAAVRGLDFAQWAQQQTDALIARGYSVVFRKHPLAARDQSKPVGSTLSRQTLRDDLAQAAVAVTYNSTAGVEAVLAGVPTVTLDQGAMAWPVAGHGLNERQVRPNRERWCWDMAWTQWTLDEIAAGDAWERLAPLMEG